MVNVAGRSRGCKTCQKRRIKCDEGRPACAKCEAAKIKCEGYAEKGFIQVDFSLKQDGGSTRASKPKHHYPNRPRKPREEGLVIKSSNPKFPASSSASDSIKPTNQDSTGLSTAATHSESTFSFADRPIVRSVPPTIPASGFLDLICQSFTSENLLRGVPNPEFLFPAHGAPVVEPAIKALSNIYFGVTHQDKFSTSLARTRYAKSVLSLSQALQDDEPPDEPTMVAVFTLGLFEFVAPSQPKGWVWHYMGLAALFERIGPTKVATDRTLRDMLDISLPMMAMAAMIARRDICMSSPAWKEAIWSAEITKTQIGYFSTALMEIMIDTPHMLIVHDDAFRQEGMCPKLEEAIQSSVDMRQRLDAWLSKWTTEMSFSFRSCPAVHIPPPVNPDTGQPYWNNAFSFSGIIPANQITRFWAIELTTATTLRRLYERKALLQGGEYDSAPFLLSAQEAGVNICRSVEFNLLDHQQGIGSFMMLFPLRVAHRVFPEGDARRAWVEMVMDIISGRKGSWQGARQILELQATYPQAQR